MEDKARTEARKKCLKILEYAPRSRAVLMEKLKKAGIEEELAKDAVEYAQTFGYVDDLRYAEEYIRSGISRKSIRRLMLELREKGVDQEIIEQVSEEFRQEEQQTIMALARKRSLAKPLTDDESVYRLISYLVNKGFLYSDVKRTVWELKHSEEM